MKQMPFFKIPRVLMSLSLLALLCFLAYWLHQAYESEKINLHRDLNYLLMSSARIVEDSLIKESYQDTIAMGELNVGFSENIDSVGLRVFDYRKTDSSQLKVSVIKRHGHHPLRSRGRRKFPGTIGLHLKGADEMNPHLLNKLISELLVKQLGRSIGSIDLPKKVKLNRLPADSAQNLSSMYSTVYSDIVTGYTVNLVVSEYKGFLLWKMVPEILIAIILFLLTFLTVWMLYRNMLKERRLSEARKNLIGNISHELNTPITSVSLILEALHSETNDIKRRNYIELATSEMARLSRLVERIMNGISLKNKTLIKIEKVDLAEFTRNIMARQKLIIEAFNGEVEVSAIDKPILVEIDVVQFTSVITNLLDNALKYSQPKPQIKINILNQDDGVVWRITDNGYGISKIYHRQIFENLFRIPAGNIHDIKGHGLGLHVVKEVVEAHAGEIDVYSELGEGTTFQITLNKLNN